MKREAIMSILGLFLIVFMIGCVSADATYINITNKALCTISHNNKGYSINGKLPTDFNGYNLADFTIDITKLKSVIDINHLNQIPTTGFPTLNANLVLDKNSNQPMNFYGSFNSIQLFQGRDYYGLYASNNDYNAYGYFDLVGEDGKSSIRGKIKINFEYDYVYENFSYCESDNDGYLILEDDNNNYDSRISALESWKQTINNTLTTLQNSITSIINTLTGHNTRISKLENQTQTNETTIINNTTIIVSNGTNPYLKYLSSSDRKNMLCGYAEDKRLTSINDLGFTCIVTYKQLRNGKETSTCKCK